MGRKDEKFIWDFYIFAFRFVFHYSIVLQQMEKSFNLKVSVRISQKCREVIDQVSFNHLILCGRQPGEHKKFQFDKIYSNSDNNEKLFQHILRVPSNLMLQGFSSMVFCVGSPNSGKTYSLAGKNIHLYEQQSEPGIIIYMMRRLFSKFKHEVSLYSTYSFWCKFLFIQRDRIRNLQCDLTEQDWHNNNNTKILIKNYSHFEQLISQVYSNNNNNNKCHTIIELILQKQTPNQQPTTSSVTFVEFGSFFYNCPFRQAEQLSMENDIQSTLLTIKNLSKAKQNSANIFDSSILTKLLRNNFLRACSFQFIGILDDSYENNLKTLNFLDIIMHKKENYGYNKNVKQQIKREELFLKGLYDKHRRVLNLLSRCIGMQLGYLQKQKKKKNFDGPILNTFYKTCQKIKYANIKKFENEKVLEQMRKSIEKQKNELSQIQMQYQQKFKKLEQEKIELVNKKIELNSMYQNIINPNIKFSSNDNSLYCRYEDDQKSYKKFAPEQEQQGFPNSAVDSDRQSKNDGKSFRMFPSTLQITTRKNIMMKFDHQTIRDKQNDKYERSHLQEINVLTQRRVNQMQIQIGALFKMILEQELKIEKQKDKIPLHNNNLLNKVKNRNKIMSFDFEQAKKCYSKMSSLSQFPYEYNEMLQNLIIQQKIQKDILANSPNSMGALSLKSLKSQKQFRML